MRVSLEVESRTLLPAREPLLMMRYAYKFRPEGGNARGYEDRVQMLDVA